METNFNQIGDNTVKELLLSLKDAKKLCEEKSETENINYFKSKINKIETELRKRGYTIL